MTIKTVKLFESAHGGYGDAQEVGNFRYNRVHGSIDARWPGQVRAGLEIQSIANANWDRIPVFAVEWTDAQGTNPQVYILVQDEVWALRFGSLTQTSTGNILSENVTTGMFHDNGSGVPLIYAGFGDTGSEANIKSITRFTPSGDATVVAAGGTTRADQLLSHSGKAYRSYRPTGGQNTCYISTLGIGRNPLTAADWGAGQLVGNAGTDVNAIIAVQHRVFAVKPEGIFLYIQEIDQWVNQTPGWVRFMHLRNGVGAFSLGNLAVIPLGDGGAVIFDGYNVKEFDPAGFDASPNAHTTTNQIGGLGTLKYWVVGATATGQGVGGEGNEVGPKEISAGDSLRVWHFDQGVPAYSDDSANLRDGDLTTSETWVINNTGDYVYIGWTRPFTQISIDFSTVQTNTSATLTVAVGTTAGSPGTYTTVAARDFTDLAGASFGQSGKIVMTEDPVGQKSWVKTTVNSVELYWVRLSWDQAHSGADAIAVSVRIQPWHPSINDTDFPLDGLDKSGNFPHIIMGTKDREKNTWHDMGSLPEPDDIGVVLYANVGGTSLNRYRNLVLIGRYRIWRMDVSAGDHPGTEPAPHIHDKCLIEAPSIVPVPGTAEEPGTKLSRLVRVRINGQEADPALLGRFYYTWDWGRSWNRTSAVERFPAALQINQPQRGYRFRWAWGWSQSSAAELLTQPALTEIEADFEILEDALDTVQERSLRDLPRF
jgi:hypothetical protein